MLRFLVFFVLLLFCLTCGSTQTFDQCKTFKDCVEYEELNGITDEIDTSRCSVEDKILIVLYQTSQSVLQLLTSQKEQEEELDKCIEQQFNKVFSSSEFRTWDITKWNPSFVCDFTDTFCLDTITELTDTIGNQFSSIIFTGLETRHECSNSNISFDGKDVLDFCQANKSYYICNIMKKGLYVVLETSFKLWKESKDHFVDTVIDTNTRGGKNRCKKGKKERYCTGLQRGLFTTARLLNNIRRKKLGKISKKQNQK